MALTHTMQTAQVLRVMARDERLLALLPDNGVARVRILAGRGATATRVLPSLLRPRPGCAVRLVAQPPLDLVLVDDRLALLDGGPAGPLAIGPSPLRDALANLFEGAWEAGVAPPAGGEGLSDEEELLLALAAAGLKDSAIALRLGIPPRTLRRRIARVMAVLGADTRFQAGVLAAARGWVGTTNSTGQERES